MKHPFINWQDGMKINQSHFRQSDFACIEKIALGTQIQLSAHNFGLLDYEQKEVDWNFQIDPSGLIRLKVLRCHAVTLGGVRVDISPELENEVDTEFQLQQLLDDYGKNAELLVALQTYPYKSTTFGIPDPEEYPPRIPFQRPSFDIGFIVNSDKVACNNFQIIIGKVSIRAGIPEKDKEYIPPLSQGSASYTFRKKIDHWLKASLEIFDGCRKLARKADAVNKSSSQIISTDSGRTISVADTARIFARAIAAELARLIPLLRTQSLTQSPVFLHIAFQQMAYGVFLEMEMQESESVNFFRKYLQGAFQQTWEPSTAGMMESGYQHFQIAEVAEKIDQFIEFLGVVMHPIDGLPDKQLNFKTDFGMNVNFVEQSNQPDPNNQSTISFDEL